MLYITLLTLLAGLAIPLGAYIASIRFFTKERRENEFRHSVMAFGGGALLSAVALVLVPDGIRHLSIMVSSFCFIIGGLFFMFIDIQLSKTKTSASQLTAMLTDFIPESLALGATYSVSTGSAILLTILIALQNIPEGFNAYSELKSTSKYSRNKIISLFVVLALIGPILGILGFIWLVDFPDVVAGIMLFAAGGILYSVFQDIAPQVPLKYSHAPPIGAVLGFLLGVIGHMLTL